MNILKNGIAGHSEWVVTESMTASAVGSGLVAVLSTPMLVALMESAAVDALHGALEDGQTSVGTRIDVQHIAATPVGNAVRATASLQQIDGRRLVFSIKAWDDTELIGQATHERFIIDQARFEAKLDKKR